MACIQYVYRRGAVYWWRRRLPIGMGSRGLVRVELSLMTRIAATAKAVASEVTRACERLLPELRHNMISAEDAKKILLDVATRHSEWLDLSASTKGDAISAEQSRRSETCSGWAFRLFAAHGSNATVGPNEEREMRAAGLDADQIVRVSNCIDFYREYGFGQPERKGLEALLRKHNIPVVDVHIAQAKNLYYRGMSAALLNTERRWSGVRPDDLTLLQASLAQGSALPLPAAVQPARVTSPDPVKRPPWLQRPEAMDVRSVEVSYDNSVVEQTAILEDGSSSIGCQDRYPTEVQGVAVPADITREDYRGLVELVTRAGDERVNGEDWDTKTADQHVRLAKLFVRFIGHDDPLKIRQSHIALSLIHI